MHFAHNSAPVDGKEMQFEAPFPEDFERTLGFLRSQKPDGQHSRSVSQIPVSTPWPPGQEYTAQFSR